MDTKKLRQKILDLAIHGKLVPQDPNDEPASVLLERIKAEKERLIKEGKIKRSKKSAKTSDMPHYGNVPFEVPEGWVWCRLGDVISIKSGDSIRVRDNRQGEYPIYGGNGINGYYSDCNVEPDTIVIGRVGFYCGSVHQTISKAWVTDNAFIVSCESVFNSKYLCHLLEWLQLSKTSNSTAQPVISGKGIYPLLIPLPPLYEQERIVSEVKRCFTLIAQIEQGKSDLQTIIKQAKSKILDLATHGKLVPQDPNDESAIELLKRINPDFTPCDNGHYAQLPQSWSLAPMQTLCSLVDGEKQNGIERTNLDVKYLRGEREAKTLTSGKYVAANSLLILVDGENSGEVFRTPIEGYQGSTFKQLSINDNMNTDYVLQVIHLHRKTLRENKVGSAIPHLNKKIFRAIEVPIPPYREQQRIVDAINIAFRHLDTIMESL